MPILSSVIAQSANGTSVTTPARDTRGASAIYLFASSFGNHGAPTDSMSNVWTSHPMKGAANSEGCLQVFHVDAPLTNAAHTFSLPSVAACYPSLGMIALSSTVASSFDSQVVGGANQGFNTPLITPTVFDGLLVSLVGWDLRPPGTPWQLHNSGDVSAPPLTVIGQLPVVASLAFSLGIAYSQRTTKAAVATQWINYQSASSGLNGINFIVKTIPVAAGVVKSVGGVPIAAVKTRGGVPVSAIKTINGVPIQ